MNISEIKKELNRYDKNRVIKYLQIKSGNESDDLDRLINTIIKKKKIKNTDEFLMRLNISAYTFMTAPQREKYMHNILL